MAGVTHLGLVTTIAMLPLVSCAHDKSPSANSTPASFAVARIGRAGVPHLSAPQLEAVRAVLAASTKTDRPRLVVSLRPGVGQSAFGTMVLFYGDPRHPDGVTDDGINAYHVIGGGCNVFYRPSDGLEYAVPGEGAAGCATWKDSAADRTARRYGLDKRP